MNKIKNILILLICVGIFGFSTVTKSNPIIPVTVMTTENNDPSIEELRKNFNNETGVFSGVSITAIETRTREHLGAIRGVAPEPISTFLREYGDDIIDNTTAIFIYTGIEAGAQFPSFEDMLSGVDTAVDDNINIITNTAIESIKAAGDSVEETMKLFKIVKLGFGEIRDHGIVHVAVMYVSRMGELQGYIPDSSNLRHLTLDSNVNENGLTVIEDQKDILTVLKLGESWGMNGENSGIHMNDLLMTLIEHPHHEEGLSLFVIPSTEYVESFGKLVGRLFGIESRFIFDLGNLNGNGIIPTIGDAYLNNNNGNSDYIGDITRFNSINGRAFMNGVDVVYVISARVNGSADRLVSSAEAKQIRIEHEKAVLEARKGAIGKTTQIKFPRRNKGELASVLSIKAVDGRYSILQLMFAYQQLDQAEAILNGGKGNAGWTVEAASSPYANMKRLIASYKGESRQEMSIIVNYEVVGSSMVRIPSMSTDIELYWGGVVTNINIFTTMAAGMYIENENAIIRPLYLESGDEALVMKEFKLD